MAAVNSLDYSERDLIGYGAQTPDPQWPGGARIAISLVLNYEEGSEVRCTELERVFQDSYLLSTIARPVERRHHDGNRLQRAGSRSQADGQST